MGLDAPRCGPVGTAQGGREPETVPYLRVFLGRFRPDVVALHTPPAAFSSLPAAAELLRELGFEGRILYAEHPGDEFRIGG